MYEGGCPNKKQRPVESKCTPFFKGVIDMPFAFRYIVIKACKPKFGSQAPIKIIMEAIYGKLPYYHRTAL